MGNPFGITLDPLWAKWATEHNVSETIAAALLLLSKRRKAEEIVNRLKPDELKLVVEVVENSPECFMEVPMLPPGERSAMIAVACVWATA